MTVRKTRAAKAARVNFLTAEVCNCSSCLKYAIIFFFFAHLDENGKER